MKKYREVFPRVAIMVETSRGYSRDILRGIMRYEMLHGPWDIHAIPGGREEQRLPDMTRAGRKGIIAHITTERMVDEILAQRLPTVSVFPTDDIPSIAKKIKAYGEVRCDSAAIGRMGAAHLLERHFPHYGFVGEIYDADWSVLRCDAFVDTVRAAGFPVHVYPSPSERERKWNHEEKRLAKWLRSLPKPIGIFAASDIRGRRVIDAAHHVRCVIPEEIAVLGVDNDELFCETSSPRLSSISLAAEKAGFEAASFLDRLMLGERKELSAEYGPIRVVTRLSSDYYHLDDKIVREALAYIQAYFMKPIGVPDVLKPVGISRRQLEIRFKKIMGHSIMDEIRKRRLEKVKQLLLESDLTLEQIAELCGFQSKNYLINVFRKEFDTTMGAFRSLHQIQ